MQLSGLLEKLNGLFPSAFIIATLTPLFCFVVVNGLILGEFSESARSWINDYLVAGAKTQTAVGGAIALGLMVAGYIFSTMNETLRKILEGHYLLKPLTSWLQSSEMARLTVLEDKLKRNAQERRQINQMKDLWKRQLKDSRIEGDKLNVSHYLECEAIHETIGNLETYRRHSKKIEVQLIKNAVTDLGKALRANRADLRGNESARNLDRDHRQLNGLIEYAAGWIENDYIQLYNEREFSFSRFTVRPTQIGNIAESVRSYAQARYGMNIDFCWTRFQKILQKNKEFYQTLTDAKTQLDFMVSLFWLTAVSAIFWLIALPLLTQTWLPFLSVWALGPIALRGCYLVTVQNYTSFADLLRCSIDLFRFDLLTELRIPLPQDSASEHEIWDLINRKLCYGEDVYLSYKGPS